MSFSFSSLLIHEAVGSGENRSIIDQSSATKVSIAEYSLVGNVPNRGLPWHHIPIGIEPTHNSTVKAICGANCREDKKDHSTGDTLEEHFK